MMTQTQNTKWTVLGLSDSVTDCECCGKRGLKRTVALENAETGAIVYYGTDCAGMAVHGKKASKNTARVVDSLGCQADTMGARWLSKGFGMREILYGISRRLGVDVYYAAGHFRIPATGMELREGRAAMGI
jgi:hypothetical protein